jgi:hypothetical protein
MRQNRTITIGEKTIVTPAARDLGEQHRRFVQADLPRGAALSVDLTGFSVGRELTTPSGGCSSDFPS